MANQLTTSWPRGLSDDPPTLAEVFAARGYQTGAFSANHAYVSWEYRVLRGFATRNDYVLTAGELAMNAGLIRWLVKPQSVRLAVGLVDRLGRRDSENIRAHFIDWVGPDKDARPFFAFRNMFDAHDPYLPGAPFDTLCGWPPGAPRSERTRIQPLMMSDPLDLPAPDMLQLRDQYDGAIAKMDQSLGDLLDEVKRRGMPDNTLVIMTSDHGEAFGEHKTFGRQQCVPGKDLHAVGHGVTRQDSRRSARLVVRDVAERARDHR
ncbi:MAG: Arylsulfatase [Gemmatimonadetes bacterium]|nr:Arylsulfatase [Gemmatimonadota bacterium]